MDDSATIRDLNDRINSNTRHDRDLEDALYANRSVPTSQSNIRATTDYGNTGVLGGANSYMEMLVQRRDSQAAQRISRSANSWSAEQKRPGSWMSGVGSITPVGFGRQYSSGVGRPLIQQRDS